MAEPMVNAIARPSVVPYVRPDWEGAMKAFLAEKQMRSGSNGTAGEYARILSRFFRGCGKARDRVTPDEVFSFA